MAKSDQIARLQRRLEAIPDRVREAVKPVLVQSAEEMASMMRHLAPEDEGDLKESIAVTGPGETTPAYSQPGGSRVAGELEAIVTAGNSDVRYAHLVEHGTSVADAQPFFWPVVRMLQQRTRNRIRRSISKAIRDWRNGK